MSKESEAMVAGALFGPTLIVLYLVECVTEGFTFWLCWNWFAVPLRAPEIGFCHSVGILLLVTMLKGPPHTKPKADGAMKWWLTIAFVRPLMIAGAAWLFHWGMTA